MKIWLIIFLVLMVSHRVQSQSRLVVNTTCLELAKPSNKQFRLICSQYDYHCLLDETFTKEFEACREWKWIPEGKCAYFNTYGRGNIDERNCVPKNNLTCSHGTIQFSSATNTKYTACYVKKEISTSLPVTTSPTGTQSDGENATSVSTSSNKKYEMSGHHLPIILGIFVPLVSLIVIYFIFMHLKYVPLYRKAYPEENDIVMNEDTVEQEPFLRKETKDSSESPPTIKHEDENITGARRSAYPKESDIVMNEDTAEQETFLRNETKDSSESPPTIKHEDENITGARKSDNSDANDPADMNESDNLSEHFHDALSSPTNIKPKKSEVSTDAQRKKLDEEKSAENASGLCIISDTSDNEEEDTQKPIDVFDDNVESLQRIAHPTEEQDREMCTKLYHLLEIEGLKLTQEVMAATLTRETGRSVKTLLNSLTDQEKNKLKEMLPEESRRILESKTELGTSFHVSYGLHRIILDDEKSPKSGWGNPVRGTDIGIGDDIERLNRIQIILQKIPNPVTVSVESYIRLLDIMIEALTRLDPDDEFKEDYKLLCCKLESIKNPNLTQTMLKTIKNTVKKIW